MRIYLLWVAIFLATGFSSFAFAASDFDRVHVHPTGWFSWLWGKPVEPCASTPSSSNPARTMTAEQIYEFGRETLASVGSDSCRLDRFCELVALDPAIQLPTTERTKALVDVIGPDFKTLLNKMLLLEGSQRTPVEEQWNSLSSKCAK